MRRVVGLLIGMVTLSVVWVLVMANECRREWDAIASDSQMIAATMGAFTRESTLADAEKYFETAKLNWTLIPPQECVAGSRTQQLCAGGPVLEGSRPVGKATWMMRLPTLIVRAYFARDLNYQWFQIVPRCEE